MSAFDLPELGDWHPVERVSAERIDRLPSDRLAATLGVAAPGDALPPLWSWLHHLEAPHRTALGPDGHAALGAFLPPLPARRRMFAGGTLTFHATVPYGADTTMRARVEHVRATHNADGPLWIVTLAHDLSVGDALAVEERRTLIYLPTTGGPRQSDPCADRAEIAVQVATDPVLLMKFSALTFNGHRIHYDLPYATQAEGYPERVTHGPLQALLLAGQAADWAGRPLSHFAFRGTAPTFCGEPLTLRRLQTGGYDILAPDGIRTMTATATFAPAAMNGETP